ncbi:hypothetical protein ACC684_28820 [Rhizobium ruizarguesonis]
MKKLISKLLASVAKGAAAFAKGLGKGGRATWDFSVGAVSGAVGIIFGRGGGAPAPNAAEELEEVMDANAAMDLEDDDDMTPEEKFQKAEDTAFRRAFGYTNENGIDVPGREFNDVFNYACAGSKEEREQIGSLMRNQTRNWVMSLSNDNLDTLARAGEYGIKNHMTNIRPISNVPKCTFGNKYEGIQLSHKEPTLKLENKPKGDWTARRDQITGFKPAAPAQEPKFQPQGFHKQLDLMAEPDMEREQTRNSAPAYRPKAAGMRR